MIFSKDNKNPCNVDDTSCLKCAYKRKNKTKTKLCIENSKFFNYKDARYLARLMVILQLGIYNDDSGD